VQDKNEKSMPPTPTRCLILACGNTLRGDDGVGPWLAQWAEVRFASDPAVRVLWRQQWTPELAEEISAVASVLFIDCSIDSAPGQVKLTPIAPAATPPGLATHHLGAAELLFLTRELFHSLPRQAQILTVGAASMELSEEFSPAVSSALPSACHLLKEAVHALIGDVSSIS
jgi:hydrogenase maturation protease